MGFLTELAVWTGWRRGGYWLEFPDEGLDTPPWAGNRKLLDEFPSMGWHSVEALAERITKGHGIVNAFVAESEPPAES